MSNQPTTYADGTPLPVASSYGCGSSTCTDCYPTTYRCEACGYDFPYPIRNGEAYACECGYDTLSN